MQHVPQGKIWDIDRALMLDINGSWGAGWDTFWWLVSQPWFWTPLFVATIWLLCRRFGWQWMLIALGFIILGLALADQTANFFKGHTPKFRPTRTLLDWGGVPYNTLIHTVKGYIGGNFGTVSGHAATSMAIGFTAAGIYRRRWFSCLMGIYVVLTCFSRMYLGVHFPLDIIFGLTAGTLIGLLMLWLWRFTNRKSEQRRQTTVAPDVSAL
jgi:undecaprenyl-diphosphatase